MIVGVGVHLITTSIHGINLSGLPSSDTGAHGTCNLRGKNTMFLFLLLPFCNKHFDRTRCFKCSKPLNIFVLSNFDFNCILFLLIWGTVLSIHYCYRWYFPFEKCDIAHNHLYSLLLTYSSLLCHHHLLALTPHTNTIVFTQSTPPS